MSVMTLKKTSPNIPERKGLLLRFMAKMCAGKSLRQKGLRLFILLLFCLLTGCAKEVRRDKLDVSAYYDSTADALREMYALIGKNEDDVSAKYGDHIDQDYKDTYVVSVFGKEERVTADFDEGTSAGGKRPVRDFKIFLKSSSRFYIDYNEALTAVFGAPVSSGQSPYEGSNGVTVWNSYDLGKGGELRFCRDKNGAWMVVQKTAE